MTKLVIHNASLKQQHRFLFKELNLSLQAGEICCVLGKNGVGKTSLLHSVCGIKSLNEGQVLFDGMDLLTAPAKKRAKIIGLLQQDQDYLFPCTVEEIGLAGRHPHDAKFIGETKEDYEKVADILEQLDLTTLKDRNITTLSGGEKRRAAVATLLTQEPTIYLLDEPTNHLDIHYQIKIMEIFRKLTKDQQKIIVIVTHDLNLVAKYADKVILIFDDGTVKTGDKQLLLTTTLLSTLYNHTVQQVKVAEQDYFFI